MKLLLDQNLSHRLVPSLQEAFPGSTQVRFAHLESAVDKAIWEYAKEHQYAIVTLDADFQEYSVFWGGPPLIIWLRCGNQSRSIILAKLLDNKKFIENSSKDESTWCIEIF